MQAIEARPAASEGEGAVITRMAPLAPGTVEGPVLELVRPAAALPLQHAPSAASFKRICDVVVAVLTLLVLAPLVAAVALAIRIETRGPVLYRQRRIGRGGAAFDMFKFRTMVDGAHDRRYELRHLNEAADGLFKISDDPRVTRVGRVLRRTHLDELPQLIDVAIGHMSLVGPRPLVPEEDALVPVHLRARLAVRPGMTGPWQITGDHEMGLTSMAQLDLDYIASWSPMRDARVLVATARHVAALRGK